jgi:hypothetical protein
MAITRTTLLSGPAAAIFNGHTFWARDGILVTPALELEAVDSDAQGVIDATASLQPVMIKFTPSAPFADLVILYPWLEGAPGASLFGSEDTPLVLIAANGVRLTFSAAAIVAMPDLHLTAQGSVAGTVTFLALGARSLPITDANRLVTVDTASVPVAPTGTPELTDDFVIIWGGAPWMNLRARDRVHLHFEIKTRPVLSDANALLDLTLEQLNVEVRFTPATPGGPREADLIAALQLQGAFPGRSLGASGLTLDIAGENLWVRLPLAQLIGGDLAFDVAHGRIGELTFRAGQAFIGIDETGSLVSLTEGIPL